MIHKQMWAHLKSCSALNLCSPSWAVSSANPAEFKLKFI